MQKDASRIKRIIKEIEAKSVNGDCIFRGEPECYEKISSNLLRELEAVKMKRSSIKEFQADIVAAAKAYTDKKDEFEILTDIQHYGGKTNLIDFTTDYNVALFFACYGAADRDGRVIVLQETEAIKEMCRRPQTPEIRVRAQRSVFVEPPRGYIEQEYQIICIPKDLKLLILQYLRSAYRISPITIYKDIHGFIRSQNAYSMAYREFYNGLNWTDEGDDAKELEKKRTSYQEAVESYTNALGYDLQLHEVYNNRGIVYCSLGKIDVAIEDFSRAIGLYPNDVGTYSNRGNAHQSKGELDLALEDHSKAIELNSEYAAAYNNRGNVYRDKGEYDRAIKDYNKAIQLKPDEAEPYNNRGVAYQNKCEIDRAIEDYNKAIQLKPDYASAYHNRGVALENKGEVERAIKEYTTSVELKPDDAKSYYNRGLAHSKQGNYDPAIEDYTKAIELKPDDVEAYNNRGNAYGKQGNRDRAIQDLTKAIGLKPGDANAHNNRGIFYYAKGNYDHAVQDLTIAIELKPNEADSHYIRGMAYAKKGEYNPAIEDYSTAIESNPEFAQAFNKRGAAWLHLREWDKAREDLTLAKERGVNIVKAFHDDYESILDFETKTATKLPEDIVAMLTPKAIDMRLEEAPIMDHPMDKEAEMALEKILKNYDRAWKKLAKL